MAPSESHLIAVLPFRLFVGGEGGTWQGEQSTAMNGDGSYWTVHTV